MENFIVEFNGKVKKFHAELFKIEIVTKRKMDFSH